ncbi:RWD-domain-containing protein, partial [Patellaria atrata CBS 101060]
MAEVQNEDEREEELSSIAAIFPELEIDPINPFSASISIPVAPESPLTVRFQIATEEALPTAPPTPPDSDDGHGVHLPDFSAKDETHHLSNLPPLRLEITLPNGYPSEKPPQFSITTSPNWIPESSLQTLKDEGFALWEEYAHGQVVYAQIDFLQQAAERSFDIGEIRLPMDMKLALLDFDIKTKREKFEKETFECGVCLEPKKGAACYRVQKCGHVFCVQCLQDFYNSCITEGDVANVKCMDSTCGKEPAVRGAPRRYKKEKTLNPSELLRIPLGESTVRRYVELKRKKKLESDKSTIYCPRNWCQGPARSDKYPKITDLSLALDSESDDEGPAPPQRSNGSPTDKKSPETLDRLSICEDCNFAFCRICKASWHGDLVRCWPRDATELSTEEQASYDYIRLHTSPCPTCNSATQKTHGCNHMSCFQCRTHFCYLCGAWLDPGNPYKHFNQKGKECYQRLWDLEAGDNGGAFVVGARGFEHQAEAEAAA